MNQENATVWTRLETRAPELASKLRHAPAPKQRAASLVACQFALARGEVRDPLVLKAVEELEAGLGLTEDKKSQLKALIARLDEKYFDLQQAAEEGTAGSDEYVRVFEQARAVAALSCAFHDDLFKASSESIYEASSTTDNPCALFAAIESALAKP